MREEMITLCGDNCDGCPRYVARTDEELEKTAQLWCRIGWSKEKLSKEEIACRGCSSHKECTYHLVECIKEHQIEKCNQCKEYPCDKIREMLKRSKEYEEICKEKCTEEEYRVLKRAFFEKEHNLSR